MIISCLTTPAKKQTKQKNKKKSYSQLEESVDVCVESWHFLALALRRQWPTFHPFRWQLIG